jgi:hypothetical protein
MPIETTPRETVIPLSGVSDKPAFRDGAAETAARAILAGAPVDHTLSDHNAAVTETPYEKEIDAANGLRGHGGRTPTAEDFDGLLTPEGVGHDAVGTDISDSTLVFGEDGSLGGTL